MKIALIQVAYDATPEAMAAKYHTLVADAAKDGATLVVLPELSLSPYLPGKPRDAWDTEPLPEGIPHGDSCRLFNEIAKENGVFVLGSLYERGGLGYRKQKGVRFNTAVLSSTEGAIGGGCRKQHVYGPYESEYYTLDNSDYPLFHVPGTALAMPTGEDLWFPEVVRIYGLKGAGIIAAPCAIGTRAEEAGFGSPEAWGTMLRSHAIANGVFIAAANRVGTESDTKFHGSSIIIAPGGEVLAQGSPDKEEIVSADLDLAMLAEWRTSFPLLLRREPQTYGVLMARLTENKPPESE